MKKRARAVPKKLRRLTREEAARLGVSYGAKRRVAAGVKTVTRSTVLYTDREVHQAAIRRRARSEGVSPYRARKLTKETFARSRVKERTLRSGKRVLEFTNLSKSGLMKKLRKYRDKEVMVTFRGSEEGGNYKNISLSQHRWVSAATRIDAGELLDPDNFDDFMNENKVSDIHLFGLTVYL